MRNVLALALLALLSACAKQGAGGGACGLTKVADVPLEFRNNRALASISNANGRALMLVDTGAVITLLRQTAVDRLKLALVEGGSSQYFGVGGTTTTKVARLSGVMLGGLTLSERKVPVAPDAEAGVAGEIDGTIGMDVLGAYETDLDVPGRHLRLYSGTPCSDADTPIGAGAMNIRGTWAIQPSLNRRDPRLYVRATLNGHAVTGLLDSGAQRSSLYADSAMELGLTPAMLAKDPSTMVHGVGAQTLRVPRHRIEELRIGPTLLRDWEVWVLSRIYRGEVEDHSAMIIGMDFLQNHRVWLAYDREAVLLPP